MAVAIAAFGAYLGLTGTRTVEGHVTELACPSPGFPTHCNPRTLAAGIKVRFQREGSPQFYDAVTNSRGDYGIDLPQGPYSAKEVVLVPQPDGFSFVPRVDDWVAGPKVVSVGPFGSTRADFAFGVTAQSSLPDRLASGTRPRLFYELPTHAG
jgi:hypothetical protein